MPSRYIFLNVMVFCAVSGFACSRLFIKSKYLIFGVESIGYREAKSKLSNIEKDVVHNLNNIGTNARGLDGKERLRILHEYFNQGTMEPFRFSFKELSESGKSVKDYIAPPGFDFRYPSRRPPVTGNEEGHLNQFLVACVQII